MIRFCLFFLFFLLVDNISAAETNTFEQITVTTRRIQDSVSDRIYSLTKFERYDFKSAALGLDDFLRRSPGFGLFRRQASRSAHPTTQGVSLRGLSSNAAGRTLVMFDGIPINDPFGGWVDWVHYPSVYIQSASLMRGGGVGPWGNQALTGVINLDSRIFLKKENLFNADFRYGSKDTLSIGSVFNFDTNIGSLYGAVNLVDSSGYYVIDPNQIGSADLPLARSAKNIHVGWGKISSKDINWSISGNIGTDNLVNGSEEAGSDTKIYTLVFSAIKNHDIDKSAFEGHFYIKYRDFKNTFVAFNSSRSEVRVVLDQFDVPARSLGGNFKILSKFSNTLQFETGFDFQLSSGETNELFRNLGNGFTRSRTAGGNQIIAGAFGEANWSGSPYSLFSVGIRADYWRQEDGKRIENNIVLNNLLSDLRFRNRDGLVINGSAGFNFNFSQNSYMSLSAYSGFRVPTLNELYRPFRVGNDITESNQLLINERIAGAEISFSWDNEILSTKTTLFRNDLYNPIVNATISLNSGFNQEFSVFIPSGGSLRQRSNIPKVKSSGIEFEVSLDIRENLKLDGSYLYTNPKIINFGIFDNLSGKRLAQVAKNEAYLGISYNPNRKFLLKLEWLYSSSQFDDDLNTRKLNSSITLDGYIGYDLSETVELYLAAENIFNNRIESGRNKNGLISLGPPLFLWIGMRLKY